MLIREFRLRLYVKDFDNMREFYEHALGFEPVETWDNGPEDRGVLLDTGSGIVQLMSAGSDDTPVKGLDLSMEVDDVHQLWEDLKDYPVIHAIRHNYWGAISFCIQDPEGSRLTFFSYEESADDTDVSNN